VALRRRKFITLLEVVKRTLFRDQKLKTKIVAGLEFLADRLLRLLIRQRVLDMAHDNRQSLQSIAAGFLIQNMQRLMDPFRCGSVALTYYATGCSGY
jgi:hypothetical protein